MTSARVTQSSVRAALGVVAPDTVLFNDTSTHNTATAGPSPCARESRARSRGAHREFSNACPIKCENERGVSRAQALRREKQRVSIALTALRIRRSCCSTRHIALDSRTDIDPCRARRYLALTPSPTGHRLTRLPRASTAYEILC